MFRKWLTAVLGTAVLAGGTLLVTPGAASADPQEAIGHETRPGQPYGGRDRARDWLGSYLVGGQQVWCVQFALTAPDSGEEYQPGDELRTKWGTPIPSDVAANISYLLLRYGNTQSPDEAAALAHLLHSWTAAPRSQSDLDPNNDFTRIAYDVDGHYAKLPQAARDAVDDLRAEAEANRGPWEAELTAPEAEQTIGQPADWTLAVQRADDEGVGGVPVELALTDASVEGLGSDGVVTTPEDGSPLVLKVTPTGPNPKITGTLSAPAERPYVREAVNQPDTTQRVVSTGGEQELSVEAATTAVTAPGVVHVGKVDAESQAGIAGVALRVTAADGTPALRQDGTPLLGADGQPAVVVTGPDGTATVPDLRAPQDVKLIEVAPAPGYEEAFDPANPPSVTGTLKPGETLELTLVNKPNTPTVPIRIPAGDPTAPAGGVPAGLLGLGGLAMAAAVGGVVLRRRITNGGRS
ncbi:MSCRAMM family protein [Saccharopolyspora sp. 5N708]|uniref:MSCRAMM family protein n=1 Tax=Saccharopolyspora sp. 5N708 TaxID=3457424 RepID=UPI003FD33649